jgi:uncharacterized delta-60 repeat protein
LLRLNTNGSVDTSFGTNGITITNISDEDTAYGLTIDSSGRLIAVGSSNDINGNTTFAIARYTANGVLDTSFNGEGKVATDFLGDFDRARAVKIDANGKIVVVGYSGLTNGNFALARYKP